MPRIEGKCDTCGKTEPYRPSKPSALVKFLLVRREDSKKTGRSMTKYYHEGCVPELLKPLIKV